MITRLLVANRGEIARRIFATCREMGIDTVAVYSEADTGATFVAEADAAVPIGPPAPSESYLRGDRIIDAARRTGADAIHPGYGFLSENAEFARSVIEAGITWVGPPPEAIEAMGSKISAKARMAEAGVPLLPSVELTDVSPDDASASAESIGFPLLIKASAGGGGRGMRIVASAADLTDAVEAAAREAESAFGDGTIYAEKYVAPSKHVEVQIFGDDHGTVVHFGERECSVQRRHQKVLEEAPSPSIDDDTRAALHAAAVAAGAAIGYRNAGTVEFLLDPSDGSFYFLEVNTRLQVEHPVTEMVTGTDLVRLQLDVAAGGSVPSQDAIADADGHAIEARVYAEDPRADYMPSVGAVTAFDVPTGVRVDAAFDHTGDVSAHYDAMIAKVVAHAPTREEATRRLAAALKGTVLAGIDHNLALLTRTLLHPDFEGGGDTELLERAGAATLGRPLLEGASLDASLVAAAVATQADRRASVEVTPGVTSGFRNVATAPQQVGFAIGDASHTVTYRLDRGALVDVAVDSREIAAELVSATPTRVDLLVDGVRAHHSVAIDGRRTIVRGPHGVIVAERIRRFSEPTADVASGSLVASMPGTVRAVNVEVGDVVAAGQTVVVMEAMKMEMAIDAPTDGTVTAVTVAAGDAIDAGAPLIVIE